MEICIGAHEVSPPNLSIYAQLVSMMNFKIPLRLKCALSAVIAKVCGSLLIKQNLFESKHFGA
jgi:hypothetical protein